MFVSVRHLNQLWSLDMASFHNMVLGNVIRHCFRSVSSVGSTVVVDNIIVHVFFLMNFSVIISISIAELVRVFLIIKLDQHSILASLNSRLVLDVRPHVSWLLGALSSLRLIELDKLNELWLLNMGACHDVVVSNKLRWENMSIAGISLAIEVNDIIIFVFFLMNILIISLITVSKLVRVLVLSELDVPVHVNNVVFIISLIF